MRSEAAFASPCGVAPVEASSGRVVRHRLNRGGNRRANSALHMIIVNRMKFDRRTSEYVARRTAEGKSKREIIRCLKRYASREVCHALLSPEVTSRARGEDLRGSRLLLGMTQEQVARELGTKAARVGEIEREGRKHFELRGRYGELMHVLRNSRRISS